MALILKTIPEVNGSRWNAAHNQIVFGFERQDYTTTSVADFNGFCRVYGVSSITPNDSNHIVGARMTLDAPPYYNRVVGKITAVSGTWFVDTDIPFVQIANSGWYNLTSRIGWSLVMQLINVITGKITIGLYSSDPKGFIRADIAAFALNELYFTDEPDYSKVNTQDVGRSLEYTISYLEKWANQDGTVEQTLPISIPNSYHCSKSANQLRFPEGSNMYQFLLKPDPVARFLTEFKQPRFSAGFPFSVSFIYDFPDGLVFDGILKRKVELYDVNGVLLGISSTQLNYSYEGFMNLLTFRFQEIINPVAYVLMWIEDDDTPILDEGYWQADLVPSYALGGYVLGNI